MLPVMRRYRQSKSINTMCTQWEESAWLSLAWQTRANRQGSQASSKYPLKSLLRGHTWNEILRVFLEKPSQATGGEARALGIKLLAPKDQLDLHMRNFLRFYMSEDTQDRLPSGGGQSQSSFPKPPPWAPSTVQLGSSSPSLLYSN